jgi:hypothetical protein
MVWLDFQSLEIVRTFSPHPVYSGKRGVFPSWGGRFEISKWEGQNMVDGRAIWGPLMGSRNVSIRKN